MDRRRFIKACGLGATALGPGRSGAAAGVGGAGRGEAAVLRRVDEVIAGGPYRDTWESLSRYVAPAWYQDAKFGIFIHWGVYSVPAWYSEWYPREMYRQGTLVWLHHRLHWGPQKKFGYKDFIPLFTAENFDPGAWIELFKSAGARYVVPVAEHHDGFAMYDCGLSEWNAAKMGPRRDVIGELAAAGHEAGLTFGLSSHRAEHWWFFNGGRKFPSDVNDPAYEALYGPAQPEESEPDETFLQDWLARSCELVDRYQPQVFWFDWWIEQPAFEPYRQKFAAYYYNRAAQWGKEVVLNYKNEAFPEGAAVLDLERSGLADIRPLVWQTDTSVSYISWGYISLALDRFKDAGRLIGDLVDIISKNGVLLLNVGPGPDGTIPAPVQDVLREIGRWLTINAEAVYGTRPWKIFGEGPTERQRNARYGLGEILAPAFTARDIRFTAKGDTLYAFVMQWPRDGRVAIAALGRESQLAAGEIAAVRLLGRPEAELSWTRREKALELTLPADKPGEHALVLAITGLT